MKINVPLNQDGIVVIGTYNVALKERLKRLVDLVSTSLNIFINFQL